MSARARERRRLEVVELRFTTETDFSSMVAMTGTPETAMRGGACQPWPGSVLQLLYCVGHDTSARKAA